jgi:mRNA-degrading endonuclease RelE of RelBE toxin-antitoxin system
MKFSIKTISIGFECPIINLKSESWNEELLNDLIKPQFKFFDILKNDLNLLKLQNGNYLLLYTLVTLIDNDMIIYQHLNEEWKNLEKSISDSISDYLSKQNIKIFRKLN